jgi:hypothetical protein
MEPEPHTHSARGERHSKAEENKVEKSAIVRSTPSVNFLNQRQFDELFRFNDTSENTHSTFHD